ncbi:MAG: hypothetical protein ACOX52_15545 [Verrucomicrobiota bacterium]
MNSVPSVAKAPDKARSFTHRLQAMVADRSDHCLNRNRNRNRSLPGRAPGPHAPSNFTAEWCQHRNNTVAVSGFLWPNPITRPFDTETDSDPDPDLASPWTFSDGL